jgi:hypothetical protein
MPLLFWYLPLMIMSGAFDALYARDEDVKPNRKVGMVMTAIPVACILIGIHQIKDRKP